MSGARKSGVHASTARLFAHSLHDRPIRGDDGAAPLELRDVYLVVRSLCELMTIVRGMFKALVIDSTGGSASTSIQNLDDARLPAGNVVDVNG